MTVPVQAAIDRCIAARVIPVIRTGSTKAAETVVAWLKEAGITIFEITMTVPDAPALIADLAKDPDLLVGVGTVPDRRAAEACIAAGTQFLVTPWVDPEIAAAANQANITLMMGAMTPTEVRAARAAGADVVKVFPAASAGGPAHIKALRSVFPGVPFCPTGGVDPMNMQSYLDAGAAFVGIGGALVEEKRILAGDKAAIQDVAYRLLGRANV
ncbi:bifunctional 4-hydroxy-2-oxoglutarate aldolase/2-dehydro-3-deoxy-phosphogluconate aldolase [Acetobacteraceae bacterium H6797]|nr:bifunctional 4-hydroxy-2-oxoglutarate aldolase/2-dehydro-3-deoxy-phosphogluconate aldolase [Acetobacteraceae bacterium H6797]